MLFYTEGGADITGLEFTELTWVPWIEMRILPESPSDVVSNILWKLWKSEIVFAYRNRVISSIINHLYMTAIGIMQIGYPTAMTVRRCSYRASIDVFIAQHTLTMKAQRLPNLDKLQPNFLEIFGKWWTRPNANSSRLAPTLIRTSALGNMWTLRALARAVRVDVLMPS